MPFDLSSAKPVDSGFDLSSAKPVGSATGAPASTPDPETPDVFDRATGAFREARGAIGEPLMALGSSMVANPVSDVAGLGAIPLHAMGAIDTDPTEVKRKVQSAMTYEPRTDWGKKFTEYNPLSLIGKGLGAVADKAGDVVGGGSEGGPGRAMLGYATKGLIENAPTFLGAKGGKMAAERLPAKQAALDVAKGENAIKDTTRETAQQAGYISPPEYGTKAAASGLAGKTKTEKIISEKNTTNATRRLGGEVGTPEGAALSKEEFNRLKEDAGKGYDAIADAAGPKLQVTTAFRDSLKRTLSEIKDSIDVNPNLAAPQRIISAFLKRIERPPEGAAPGMTKTPIASTIEKTATEQPGPPIMRTLEKAATESPGEHAYGGLAPPPSRPITTAHIPELSTPWVMKQIQQLRRDAKDDFAKRNSATGTARLGVANELENMIEENLSRTGQQQLVDQFRDSRTRFAKIYLLERVVDDATGKVNLAKLATLADSTAYKGVLTGEFKTAADFAKTFRKAAQKSTGEAAPRLTVFDGMFGIGSIISGHPVAGAIELGGRLGIPALGERGLLQNETPNYRAGRGMQRTLPPLGAALGADSQTQ